MHSQTSALPDCLTAAIRQTAAPLQNRSVLTLEAADSLAAAFGMNRREMEIAALDSGVVPVRYLRNVGAIGLEGQAELLRATVAVVGLGGLGGYVLEALARSGVGRILAIDYDVFEEHNLNRQMLSDECCLGRPKADAARERVAAVNSAVEVVSRQARLTAESAPALLGGAGVVVDALDTLPDRLVLQAAAAALGAPLVHGAIAGFMGQVMVIMPGDPGLRLLYPSGRAPEHGLERSLGMPAATPMLVAALQAQETVKLITGVGETLRHRLMMVDCESATIQVLQNGVA